jgi:serine/threonine-protein phosphatase 4 regulatory subunit 1
MQIRQSTLIEIFEEFYNDENKQINKVALAQLGQFIYSLKGSAIHKPLLNLYISLADETKTQDEDLVFHCAYTFPAVLLTVGVSEWPALKVVYNNLIKRDNVKVLKTMAAYIHEIAKIVGQKITTAELTLVLKTYLKDETTQTIILAHLHDFLGVLSPTRRLKYIPKIKMIAEESEYNWRQREILAINAAEYAKLFNIGVLHNDIMPIIYSLVKDKVHQVRVKACLSFYNVVTQLKPQPKYFKEAIEFILKLFASTSYRERQTFVQVCEGFMCDKELFPKYFLTQFLTLQRDIVLNVRLTLARVLYTHMKTSGVLASNIHIIRTIDLLKNDSSIEVRECINEASKEWNKMEEIERKRQEELEQAQEIAATAINSSVIDLYLVNDEEMSEEMMRQEVVKALRKSIKVDEIDR